MKLWKLSQDVNRGYDTFDSCVVAAETAEAARQLHPNYDPTGKEKIDALALKRLWVYENASFGCWAPNPLEVTVELLGEALPGTKEGVILASFNAG